MLNSGIKFRALCDKKKKNILPLVLSEKKFLSVKQQSITL